MAKIVFVCVCIFVLVYFLSFRVYLYTYLRRICVFLAFSGFTCCSLSSSPHQPAFTGKRRRSALRLTRSLYKWDFNPLNGISGRVCEFWPRFSVFLPRMHGKKCISFPPVLTVSICEIRMMMMRSMDLTKSRNTGLTDKCFSFKLRWLEPLSWSNSQWYHGTIIELK